MNKKAESVKFVVIITVGLILIGLAFITFGSSQKIVGNAVYSNSLCYSLQGQTLTPMEVSQCCIIVKNSNGCEAYVSNTINDKLFKCGTVILNQNAINICGG